MFIPLHDGNALKHIKLQYVTLSIIALNIIIWVFSSVPNIDNVQALNDIFYSYGFVPSTIFGEKELPIELIVLPESATFLSYSFFHGGFMHLAGNMLFIWVFGDNVEDAMGHFRFLLFYLLCAFAGSLAHGLVLPDSDAPLVGASGAAAGIVAAYIMLHPKVRVWILALGRLPLKLEAMYVIGAWILFQIYKFVTTEGDQVSWAAHVGGIIAGAILIVLMKRKEVPLFDGDLNGATNVVQKAEVATAEKPLESAVGDEENSKWGR